MRTNHGITKTCSRGTVNGISCKLSPEEKVCIWAPFRFSWGWHHETYLYNFDPLKHHFYIVKLGFTRAYIIFLISDQNIDCEYSLEPPRRGGSNGYPQSMFEQKYEKISEFFYLKKFSFLEVKFSIYLNRRVFVMV